FVVTGKARACIRRFIRTQQRAQYVELGRAMMQKEFQHEGYEYADKSLDGVLKKFKAEETEDLLAQVGEGMLGIVTTGKGVTIHTIDCETLESFAETPERWLDVAWDQDPDGTEQHVGRL